MYLENTAKYSYVGIILNIAQISVTASNIIIIILLLLTVFQKVVCQVHKMPSTGSLASTLAIKDLIPNLNQFGTFLVSLMNVFGPV